MSKVNNLFLAHRVKNKGKHLSFVAKIKQRLLPSRARQYRAIRTAFHKAIEKMAALGCQINRVIRPLSYPKLENGAIYLHLGCGDINHPKFVNIDGRPAPHIHYVQSLDNLSQFSNESVDLIYASHCLEHFPHAKVPEVLEEWHRVLKTGGILRLSVPDFDRLLLAYQESNQDIYSILPGVMGGQDYSYNFHMVIFNQAFLRSLLKETGFHQIEEWLPGQDELTSLDDFSTCEFEIKDKKIPISLNLQATK
jgi:predicted SAM-dependent methyltransferase